MRLPKALPVLFLLLDACIDPLPVTIITKTPQLVVDGWITDEPGPYQVKISWSSTLDESLMDAEPVSGAFVYIVSDAGEDEYLNEIEPGVYQSHSIQGQVGRTYQLQFYIWPNEGNFGVKEYASTPQKLLPAGSIDEIYTEFKENAINGDDPSRPQDALNVFIDASGVEDQSRFFRWRWTGVYHAVAAPELRTKGLPGGAEVPDPPPCSGYIVEPGQMLLKVGECTCCSCWPYEYSSTAILSDSRFTSQYEYKKINVAAIPVVPMRFHDKYYIEIEQLSVSEDVYSFWKLVKAQQDAAGSLFQPSAVKVVGNIESTSHPSEQVLGIFSASAVTRKHIFLTKEMVSTPLDPIQKIAEDCTLVYTSGTNQKPLFW